MPKNEKLRDFVRRTVPALGKFGVDYVKPLTAFLAFQDEPEQVAKVIERGMTQQSLEKDLELLLSNDEMLAKCCGDVETLAKALDILFFGPLPDAIYYGRSTLLGLGVPDKALDQQLDSLEAKLYGEGEFYKTAHFHLFNVSIFQPLDYTDKPWRFQELSYDEIKSLLQPNVYSEFLRAHCDRSFVSIEDSEGFDTETMADWLTRRWWDASAFRRTLQLASDGSLDIDYVIPTFSPPWVNQVHGGGIFHMGNPRKQSDSSKLRPFLHSFDLEYIKSVEELLKRYGALSQLDQSKAKERVKRAIGIAMDFFEESHRKHTLVERFANLMIALEALYTPSDKSELTYRVSQTCAILIGSSSGNDSPESIYRFLKSMFHKRGNLFHGNYDGGSQAPEPFISEEELARLYSLVRKSLIAYMCLYIKGHESLKELRQRLEDSVLDGEQREILQSEGSIDIVLGNN